MLDTGSNTSPLFKAAAKKLGLTEEEVTDLKSQVIGITLVSPVEEHIKKLLLAHTVTKPCSSARTTSKSSLKKYDHLNSVMDKLHLSGESVDLLIGTNFADGFVDVLVISGEPGDPIAKRNCLGWYILSQLTPSNQSIQSINVGTMSVKENIKLFVQQDQLGVKPIIIKLCTCTDNEMRENKFVRFLSESTTFIDGRIQVKMPWKENGQPIRQVTMIWPSRECIPRRSHSKEKCCC